MAEVNLLALSPSKYTPVLSSNNIAEIIAEKHGNKLVSITLLWRACSINLVVEIITFYVLQSRLDTTDLLLYLEKVLIHCCAEANGQPC